MVVSVLCVAVAALVFACRDSDEGSSSCGNGRLDTSEACEGFDLRGASCETEGFNGGRLKCTAQCTFDTSECFSCGNGKKDADEVCDGADLAGATCASLVGQGVGGTLACSPDCRAYDTAGCAFDAPKPMLTACDPAAAKPCEAGLTCLKTPSGHFCLVPCDPNGANSCGAGRACERLDATTGACADLPNEGERCRPATGCADVALGCTPTFGPAGNAVYTCAQKCASRDANQGQGTCAVGKLCAPSQTGEADLEGNGPCSPRSCNATEGYECRAVLVSGVTELRCARDFALCAEPIPLYPFNGAPVPPNMLCDRAEPTRGNRMCALSGSPTGRVVNPARVECYPYFDAKTDVGVCVATCDMEVLNTASDGACGSGATCGVPPTPDLFITGTAAIACTAGGTTCAGTPFPFCVDLGAGFVCARPIKICLPN
jgi:hypothetical protein